MQLVGNAEFVGRDEFASPAEVAIPAPRRLMISCRALPAAGAALDVAILAFAATAGEFAYSHGALGQPSASSGLGSGLLTGALFVSFAQFAGLYRLPALLAPGASLARLAGAGAVAQLAAICVLFLLKSGADHSRGATIAAAVLALGLVPLGRLTLARLCRYAVRRGAIQGRRVVTLGDSFELERLEDGEFPQFGMEEVGRVSLSGAAALGGGLIERDRARVAQAVAHSREAGATEFAVVMPWGADAALSELCALLSVSPLTARLYPDEKIRRVLRLGRESGLARHFSVMLQRAPLSGAERAAKRALDVVFAAAALAVLAPALLAIAALIKLDSPGPAIFRQRRCGFDNRQFVMFKFRTMRVAEDCGPIVQATRNDRRVTRIGRALRRASLDELPQFINVLRGDMSLVGPRPHALAHDDEYKARIANYALRHHVKPGLTGAAQVAGLRGATPQLSLMERRVERDLWYIDHWSMALDLKIMAATCGALLRSDAY